MTLESQSVYSTSYILIHSFHWHAQNSMIPCRSQELLPHTYIHIYIYTHTHIHRVYENDYRWCTESDDVVMTLW